MSTKGKTKKVWTEDAIRELVHDRDPVHVPFVLNEKELQTLTVRIHMFRRNEDLFHLRQQAVVAEAINALHRGEDLSYLEEL